MLKGVIIDGLGKLIESEMVVRGGEGGGFMEAEGFPPDEQVVKLSDKGDGHWAIKVIICH